MRICRIRKEVLAMASWAERGSISKIFFLPTTMPPCYFAQSDIA